MTSFCLLDFFINVWLIYVWKEIHPSIIVTAFSVKGHWGARANPSCRTCWTGGQSITGLTYSDTHPFTVIFIPKGNLESPVNPYHMSLDWKSNYPQEIHTGKGRTCKLNTDNTETEIIYWRHLNCSLWCWHNNILLVKCLLCGHIIITITCKNCGWNFKNKMYIF